MKKIGIITQARTTSTRLPKKIFKEIKGHSLLDYHLDRLLKSDLPLIVATTVNESDDCIADFCKKKEVAVYRGDEHDVLARFWGAASQQGFDAIVRITSDCPLVDGGIIDDAAKRYLEWNDPSIYYSNCNVRTFPRGFDFEIFSIEALGRAYRNAIEKFEREHVTPYIRLNEDGLTRTRDYLADEDMSRFRLTVDEEADFALIKILIEDFGADQMSYGQIKEVLVKNPQLAQINAHVGQRKMTTSVL